MAFHAPESLTQPNIIPKEVFTADSINMVDSYSETPLFLMGLRKSLWVIPRCLLNAENLLKVCSSRRTTLGAAVALGRLDDLLGVDFGNNPDLNKKVKALVGDWWERNEEFKLSKQQLVAEQCESTDVDIF